MAATTFANMAFNAPFGQQNQCIDPNDMDSFVDFGAMPSPGESSSGKAPMSRSVSAMTSPNAIAAPLDFSDEAPVKPSHEYGRFKQQTGIPTGSYASLAGIPEVGSGNDFDFGGFNSGLGDFGEGSSSMFMGSNSGLNIDTDMSFDMGSSSGLPAFFYPSSASQNDDFVDPSAITSHAEQSNVRFYPGMHKQQAAIARAQAQAQQQRQQQQQQQQQQMAQQQQKQQPEPVRSSSSRKSVTPIDARTEETIARVVNQIRQNSSFASDAASPTGTVGNSRSRRDDEDMDDDERLLNSEEGKKLSSKERRQLRNKVSARAFRSRRKEYIGQLEGDLAGKANELQDLKNANHALMEENARFRELTVKLLRHPAFSPFLEDISRDPSLSDSLSKVTSSMNATAAVSESSSQLQIQQQPEQQQTVDASQQQDLQIGMATIPETQLDFSALNLNGNNWGMPNGFGYQPQVFAVTELPEGPAEPLELASKGEESIVERFSSPQDSKLEYPEIESPAAAPPVQAAEPVEVDESDPTFILYADIPRSSIPSSVEMRPGEPIFGHIAPEKAFARIEVTVTDGSDALFLEDRLATLCARAEAPYQRLQLLSAEFE